MERHTACETRRAAPQVYAAVEINSKRKETMFTVSFFGT